MTYHASRIPLAVDQGTLTEITADDMKTMGLSEASFAPAPWDAVHVDGKQYAVPFDTHPIVLYYNKDKLAAAGLIGDDGLPKDLNGIDNFNAALKKLKDGGTKWPISNVTADGSFVFRTIYSLLCQQDGSVGSDGAWLTGDNADKLAKSVGVIADWVKDGYTPSYTDYPSTVALFTSGDAAMMINGVWEVPDDDRPQQAGQAVQLGRHRAAGSLRPPLHLFGLALLRDPEQRRQAADAREACRRARGDQVDGRATRSSGRPPATSRPTRR